MDIPFLNYRFFSTLSVRNPPTFEGDTTIKIYSLPDRNLPGELERDHLALPIQLGGRLGLQKSATFPLAHFSFSNSICAPSSNSLTRNKYLQTQWTVAGEQLQIKASIQGEKRKYNRDYAAAL